jgi:ABC-type amino acid transport substrate-binding protein
VRSKRGLKKQRTFMFSGIFLLMILAIFIPGCGFAAPDDDRDTLVLLGNEKLPPIVYNDNGTAKGVVVDIAQAMGEKIGYKVKVMTMNWEQAQKTMLQGEAHGLLQINPNPDRNKFYDFSNPLLKSDFSIFVRDINVTIRSIDDLKGKHVGVEAGGYPSTLLRQYEGINLEIIYDWKTSFKDLSEGVLDAIVVDRWIGEYELAQSRISNIKIVGNPIETKYSRIAVRKGDVQTLSLINSGLNEIKADGTLDKIMKQWQGKRVMYLTQDYYRAFLMRSALLFLFLVAWWPFMR